MALGLNTIEKKASSLLQAVAAERRCHRSRHTALREYGNLIRQRGCAPVDERTRKRIEAYARERFGSAKYAPWLVLYTAHRGEFKEGWIPQDYFFVKVLPVINPRAIANVSLAKTLTRSLFGDASSPDVVSRVDGTWMSKDGDILDQEEARERCFDGRDHVYLKADDRNRGDGIRIADKSGFNDVCKAWTADFVVQFPVDQHPDLSRFHAASVATLRVLTYKSHGRAPEPLATYLRFAQGDWRYVSSSGNSIRVPINMETGTLEDEGADESWNLHRTHPDSGVAFGSVPCPGYRSAVDLCLKLHLRIPQLALIGWDIAIDGEEQTWLLEWGAVTPGFSFVEAASGPLFAHMDVARLREGRVREG
jgi:hypothetical protein